MNAAGKHPRVTGLSGPSHVLVEVCVDDAAGATTADRAGADRIELCTALIVGGLTPSIGTVQVVVEQLRHAGVQVLIRPRHGDFVFDATELRTMTADIAAVRAMAENAAVPVGFVIGALSAGSEVDEAVTAELVAACDGAPTTFHRAFDLTPDLDRSLDALIALGIDRVLTGGGTARALDGAAALSRLVRRAEGRIGILAGGSVRPHNAAEIVAATGVTEVHFRAVEPVTNHLSPRHPGLRMSMSHAPDEEVRDRTAAAPVAQMLVALGRHS